jgi:hypothetical protein
MERCLVIVPMDFFGKILVCSNGKCFADEAAVSVHGMCEQRVLGEVALYDNICIDKNIFRSNPNGNDFGMHHKQSKEWEVLQLQLGQDLLSVNQGSYGLDGLCIMSLGPPRIITNNHRGHLNAETILPCL